MKIINYRSYFFLFSTLLLFFFSGIFTTVLGKDNDLWKRFTTELEISDLDREYYQEALLAKNNSDWDTAFSSLEKISDPLSRKEYVLLFPELYFLSSSYAEVFDYIDNLPLRVKIVLFDDLIEYYILSALNTEQYEKISEFIELQREYFSEEIHSIYKQTLYNLLVNGKNEQVIDLTDIFPNSIYHPGEKNFILGIAYYNLQYYRLSYAFMRNVLDSGNEMLLTSAYDYISLISYYLQDDSLLPEDLTLLSNRARFNLILYVLENSLIDEANSLSLLLENDYHRSLIDLFIAWENNHFKTAATLLTSIEEEDLDNYPLLNLIMGETFYHNRRFREAEAKFRKYLTFNAIDEQYANHSMGYCFYGYYRFNSTAYYWMKNLQEEKSFYDSLAVYNLAQLYSHTENYHTALHYFNNFITKYSLPENDQSFVINHLKTLEGTGEFARYISFFEDNYTGLPMEERIAILRKIGEHYEKQRNQRKALEYYSRILEYKTDYRLILKTERIRFNLGEYRDSEDFILTLLEEYPESDFNIRLANDLSKFYLNQRQYNKALSFIGDFLDNHEESVGTDSLLFFDGLAHKELKNIDKALDILLNLHQTTDIDNIRQLSRQQIEQILLVQDSRKSITLLIDILEDCEDEEIGFDYLRILARVYEKAYLYNEANEIYHILIEQDVQSNDQELFYLIAVNEIYQKRYEIALDYIEQILTDESSIYFTDALFLKYLAEYSLGNLYKALNTLLTLYYDYKKSPPSFDIVNNLIELLIEMDLKLFAWHFMGEYYPHATRSEEFTLQKFGDYLIQELDTDIIYLNQIMDIRTIIFLTIKVLEDYDWNVLEDHED